MKNSLANGKLLKTIVYYIGFVSLGLAAAFLGPTLSDLAKNTQSELSEISILFTARSLGYLLSSLMIGRVYDRKPGHPIMATVLFTMAAMLALTPFIPILWVLVFAMLILGVGEGCLDVGTNTLLVWVHQKNVGPFMNGLHFSFGLGAFLSPIFVAWAILNTGGISWAFWLLALCMLPAAIGLLWLPSPARREASKGTTRGNHQSILVFLTASMLFLYVGAEIGYGGWIFTYVQSMQLADKATAAYLTAAFWGALTLGRLLAVPISTRLKPGSILAGSLIGCLASMGVLLLWPDSMPAIWIGTLGLGFSMAAVFPSTLTYVEQRIPLSGQITSFFFVGSSLGGMTLPWLIGQLIGPIGPQVVLYVITIDLIMALAVFSIINLRHTRLRAVDPMELTPSSSEEPF